MDTANAITTLMLESSTSPLRDPVEPLFRQELSVSNMQDHGDFLEVGQQITQLILTSPTPEKVLPKIAAVLGKIFQVDVCLIASVADHQVASPTADWRKDVNTGQRTSSPLQLLDHPVLASLLRDTPLLAISESQTTEIDLDEESLRGILGIQTRCQSKVNGLILLGRKAAHAWSEEERELLKVVSEPVALAISQAQLHHQVVLGSQYKALVNQLTLAVRSAIELNQILNLSVAGTAQVLEVKRSCILLLKYADPLIKSRSLKRIPKARVTVASEWLSTQQQGIDKGEQDSRGAISTPSALPNSFGLSECQLCQQAFTQAPEPLVIRGRADNPAFKPAGGIFSLFDLEAMPSLLMVPLIGTQNAVLGFLVLQHHQSRSWQLEEIELVKSVGAQTSTAILQNQTLRQVQALVEERTAQLQGSLEVQARLYEKTRQQVDLLRQLNQLKDEFVSTMSHELRTPLTKMKMAILNLRRPGLSVDKQALYLDILEQECSQEISLIEDLLKLQQLESQKFPVQLQKIDLKQMIEDLTESFQQKWADKGVSLAVKLPKRSLMIQTDPDSLYRILKELLTNAGKYSAPDTTIYLRVTHQANQPMNEIVLTLTNIGSGISPTEVAYIFDKFRRGQGVTQQAIPGTGLGLALVRSLVQHLNGTIAVVSCPAENTQFCETCFTLTLPQFFGSTKAE